LILHEKSLCCWPGGEPGGMILGGAEDPKPVASDALLALFKFSKTRSALSFSTDAMPRKESLMNFVIWLTPISIVTSKK